MVELALATTVEAALSVRVTLSTTALKATTFARQWTAVIGATGGSAGYDVLQNGIALGSVATRSFAVTGLTSTTSYSTTVVARDNSSHVSAPSSARLVTTPTDPSICS